MKKIFSTLAAVTALWPMEAILTPVLAQVEQRIVVSEYMGKEEKTPLSQVGVTVMNAGAALSDQNGEATLRFRTLHAGDRVNVRRIEKAGYEIFNSQAIEQWNISPQRPFQIVLCQSAKLQALRDQYNRIARESYAKQYNAEKAKLATERKKTKMLEETYAQKMRDLENQYQQQLEDLEKYVDQFARIDLSELNSEQQKLIDLVKKGKIDEAIRKYEEANYPDQYQKQCEEISKIDRAQAQLMKVEAEKRTAREKLYQAIGRQVATYRLAGGRENFQKVTNLLKAVADADTTQLDAVWAYAVHALDQQLLDESEKYASIFMRANKDSPSRQAAAYSILGQGYLLIPELDKAQKAYSTSLKIYEQLAEKESERYTADLLTIQSQISDYYLWVGDYASAEKILNEAIPLCEKMEAANPDKTDDTYRQRLCKLYSNRSLVECANGKEKEAMETSEKASELSRALNDNTAEGCALLLSILANKGYICYTYEKWDEYVKVNQEYFKISETAYKQNPKGMLNNYQAACNNLAESYLHIKDYAECEKAFTKSEELLNQMIKESPIMHFYYDQFNLYDTGVKLYDALGNAQKKAHYIEAARTAFYKMTPEEQALNRELMDSIEKLK